jgi:hypothetical protein
MIRVLKRKIGGQTPRSKIPPSFDEKKRRSSEHPRFHEEMVSGRSTPSFHQEKSAVK